MGITLKSSTAALAGTGIVTAIAGLTTLAMVLIGLPPAAVPSPQAAVDRNAITAEWKQSPAIGALTDALNNPPAGWAAQGDLQQLVTAPLPYSCPLAGLAASVSLARTYTSGGARFQVITLAYTAGLGAEAIQKQGANAYVCAGPDTPLSLSGANGPAADAKLATTTRGGVRASVLSSRRGDVITYLAGSPTDPLQNLATAFDDSLTGKLGPVCANQGSTVADGTRSPWSAAGYKQYTEGATVSIADVPLPSTVPTVSPGLTGPAHTPAASATLEQVSIPAPGLVNHAAAPMTLPAFPVAPAMPSRVDEPAAPAAPAAKATLEKSAQVPANDAWGPGCGWAFTGMKPLAFDDAAAAAARTALLTETKATLEKDAKAWQASVLAYWTDYAGYRTAAAAYNAYAARVDEVNKAWAVIGDSWDSYSKAVQDRTQKIADRADFLARQDAARKAYEAKVAACAAAPSPSPTPSPSASPSPSATPPTGATVLPSPSATPSPSPSAQPGCPADRPAILDQAAPEVPSEPIKPADPAKG